MEKRNNTSATASSSTNNSSAAAASNSVLAASQRGAKVQQNLAQADGAPVRSRNQSGEKKSNSEGGSNNQSAGGTFNENDTFNKHYNKELRVSKDEIPIVLGELNDSAIQFIKREQWEKALNLLQKAYGIMDVVDFTLCRRDKFNLFILFHNMALCYQKLQMLDECAQCIEQSLEYMPADQFDLEERSISNRMRKLTMMGKLKLQYCAILSQVHRHKDALEQSKEGVRISHHCVNDLRQLCEFYIKREDIEQQYGFNANMSSQQNQNNSGANAGANSRNMQLSGVADSELTYNSYRSHRKERKFSGVGSRNRSFCQFLNSQQEAYYASEANQIQQNSVMSHLKGRRPAPIANLINESSSLLSGCHNMSQFYSLNFLEESMSYIERTARKLMPILNEIKKRMVPEKALKDKIRRVSNSGKLNPRTNKVDTIDSIAQEASELYLNEAGMSMDNGGNDGSKKSLLQQADMKNILGYLNQGEWTTTLSIGSIMQLQAVSMKDLLEQGKNELELNRESFIQKVSLLAVAYFCYSTEIRFILQMKEDPTYDPTVKQKESEYWHAKSLEIAWTFLPSECPLLNHINLSYQKHYAPVKQTIMEEEEVIDDLRVVKPLNGIDNPKFQPIIRELQGIQVVITPYQMTPLNQVTQHFLSQIVSFNDYQESTTMINQGQTSLSKNLFGQAKYSNPNLKDQMGQSSSNRASHKRVTTANAVQFLPQNNLQGGGGPPQNQALTKFLQQEGANLTKKQQMLSKSFADTNSPPAINDEDEDDVQRFEQLLDKLIRENKIDKLDILKKLQHQSKLQNRGDITSENILIEERQSNASQDILLDEQIMAAEDDEMSSNNNHLQHQEEVNAIDSEDQIAMEARHQIVSNNHLFKFRKHGEGERPKTSNGPSSSSGANHQRVGAIQHQSIGSDHNQFGGEQRVFSHIEKLNQYHKHVEEKKKAQGRPLSGGLQQKMKSESQRSRVNKMNPHHNMSMYEKFAPQIGSGGAPSRGSPDKSGLAYHHQQSSSITGTKGSGHSQYLTSKIAPTSGPSQIHLQQQQQPSQQHQKMSYLAQQQQSLVGGASKQLINNSSFTKNDPSNIQAYDDLKKRLLSEYKKLTSGKKNFDEQVREKYKNLKQRAVSGKKTASNSGSSHHQMPNTAHPSSSSNQPSVGSTQFTGTGAVTSGGAVLGPQMSPRHHLNVYKPTFIINNSFANESASSNKEIDMVEQQSQQQQQKKFSANRPSSKQGQVVSSYNQANIPASSANQILATSTGRNASMGASQTQQQAYDRIQGVHSNQQQINNQQLLGLLIQQQDSSSQSNKNNANGGGGSSSLTKKSMKTSSQHHQPVSAADFSYVKQLINNAHHQQQDLQQQMPKSKQNSSQASQVTLAKASNQVFQQPSSQQQFREHQFALAQQQLIKNEKARSGSQTYMPSQPQQMVIGQNKQGGMIMQQPNQPSNLSQMQPSTQLQYEKLKKKLANY